MASQTASRSPPPVGEGGSLFISWLTLPCCSPLPLAVPGKGCPGHPPLGRITLAESENSEDVCITQGISHPGEGPPSRRRPGSQAAGQHFSTPAGPPGPLRLQFR
eukprot:EG_transcript_20803